MKRSFLIKLTCFMAILLILLVPFSASIVTAQPAEKIPVIIGFREFQDAALVRSHGGEIKYVYEYILAIAASLPPPAIDALKKNPNVDYVEADFEVYALTQTTPWGIQKIRAPEVWATGNKGTGIKVAILDTGIDIKHPDLKVVGGVSYVWYTLGNYNDDNGHGTHCAGIVAALDNGIGVVGVAPEAALYAVKVLDMYGSGYLSDVNYGIEWCITYGMQVISMSFGSASDSISLHQECDKAYNSGIVLVAAAGNSGPGENTIAYPAKYSSVIAVGATDSNDVVASFSSRGPELSVVAPGVNIYSTYKGSTYKTLSGTSMACPHVTGTVALILRKAAHTPAEVRGILQKTAVDLGPTGWDSAYGYGRIDAYAAVQKAVPSSPTVPSAPQNLQATAGNGQVTLTWSAPASDGGSTITQYKIYRGTSSGGESFFDSVSGTTLTYTNTELTNGVTYYYQVTAVNSVGESPPSNEASATPTAPSTTQTMHVSSIKMWYQKVAPYYIIYMKVTVVDTSNSPVSGATVYLTLTLPSGSTASGSGVTGTDGTVTFVYGPTKKTGTYTSTVTNVTKDGWTYDSKTGVTTASLKVP